MNLQQFSEISPLVLPPLFIPRFLFSFLTSSCLLLISLVSSYLPVISCSIFSSFVFSHIFFHFTPSFFFSCLLVSCPVFSFLLSFPFLSSCLFPSPLLLFYFVFLFSLFLVYSLHVTPSFFLLSLFCLLSSFLLPSPLFSSRHFSSSLIFPHFSSLLLLYFLWFSLFSSFFSYPIISSFLHVYSQLLYNV